MMDSIRHETLRYTHTDENLSPVSEWLGTQPDKSCDLTRTTSGATAYMEILAKAKGLTEEIK